MSNKNDLRDFLNKKQIQKDYQPTTGENVTEYEDDCLDLYDPDVELLKNEEKEYLAEIVNEKDYIEVSGKDIEGGSYTRVVIIGDFFLSHLCEFWPTKSKIKPYFLYKNKLSIHEFYLKFGNHHFLKDSKKILVLFVLGLHDLAQYGTYSNSTCSAHNFVEYIHELNPVDGYLKKLIATKEAFLMNDNLSVVFSYLPNLYNIKPLIEINKLSGSKVKDCLCSGVIPDLSSSSIVTYLNLNQKKFVAEQLNFVRESGTLEYYGPPISFVNGKWIYAMDAKKIEKKSAVLNHVLNDYIFDGDVEELNKILENHLMGMRANILRNKFRIAVVGDKWIESVARRWSGDVTEWPFFYFCNHFTFDDLRRSALSFIKNNEIGLIMTAVPAGELFTIKTSSKCGGHEPLQYPVPHKDLLRNPKNFAKQLIGKMMALLQEIKTVRKHCGVIFMTCYPMQFASYYEYLTETHANTVGKAAHPNGSPVDVNFSDFYTKIGECAEIINQYIDTVIKEQNLPSCDISRVVNSKIESFVFPTYIKGKCPSVPLEKALLKCIETCVGIYKDLIVAKKLSFTHTEKYLRDLQAKKEHPEIGNVEKKKRNTKRNLDDRSFDRNKRSKISGTGPGVARPSGPGVARPSFNSYPRSNGQRSLVVPRTQLMQDTIHASQLYRSSVNSFRPDDSRGNFDQQMTNYRLSSYDDSSLLARGGLLRHEPTYSTLGSFASKEYRLTSDDSSNNFVPSESLRDRGTRMGIMRPSLENQSSVNNLASRIYGLMTNPRVNDLNAARSDTQQFGGSYRDSRYEVYDHPRSNFDSRVYGMTNLSFADRNDGREYRDSDDMYRLAPTMTDDIRRSHFLLDNHSTEERLRPTNFNAFERESIGNRLGPRIDRPSSDVLESLALIGDRQKHRALEDQYDDSLHALPEDRPALTVLKSLAMIGDRRHYEKQLRKHMDTMINGREEPGFDRAPVPVRHYEVNRLTNNTNVGPNYAQMNQNYVFNGRGRDMNAIQGVSLQKLAALDVLSTIGVVKDPPSKARSKLKI